jgi:hypothetical protein
MSDVKQDGDFLMKRMLFNWGDNNDATISGVGYAEMNETLLHRAW